MALERMVTVRAFGGRLETVECLVDVGEHPRVRVWDSVGKLYTVCHSLTPRDEARIVRAARDHGAEVQS